MRLVVAYSWYLYVSWWSPVEFMNDGPNGFADSWVFGIGFSPRKYRRTFIRLLGFEVYLLWGRV